MKQLLILLVVCWGYCYGSSVPTEQLRQNQDPTNATTAGTGGLSAAAMDAIRVTGIIIGAVVGLMTILHLLGMFCSMIYIKFFKKDTGNTQPAAAGNSSNTSVNNYNCCGLIQQNVGGTRQTRHKLEDNVQFDSGGDSSSPVDILQGQQQGTPADATVSQAPTANSSYSTVPNDVLESGNLADCLNAISDLNNWEKLGLNLGLKKKPTLDKIDLQYHSRIEKCKTEMLQAWFNWTDNVDTEKYGRPSWKRLVDAVRIDDKEIADKIVKSEPWKKK